MSFQTKACALPYKWPLLADGQDPNALEARLAFHLHRLSLTGEPLRAALQGKAYLATALSQGRVAIENSFIEELAVALNIAADELLRPLLQEETNEWSFYRTSANNKDVVWKNTATLMRTHNISLREAAAAIGVDFSDLAKAITGERPRVLDWQQAQRLSSITTPPADPHSLLPDPPSR